MTINTLIIPIAIILLVVGLGWFIIYAKGLWWAKLIYMAVSLTFGIMVWNGIETYRGWPTTEQTPQRFVLLWAEINEPEPKTGFEGAIYVWLTPYEVQPNDPGILDYHPEPGEPRAFKLPYSRGTHEKMEKAKGMIKKGRTVIMERRKKGGFGKPGDGEGDEEGDGAEDRDGKQGRGRRGGHAARPYDEFYFYEMPPPAMPDKP